MSGGGGTLREMRVLDGALDGVLDGPLTRVR
ncbi:hypothetical protein TrRE_jg2784, partial [Triparma retinervis]